MLQELLEALTFAAECGSLISPPCWKTGGFCTGKLAEPYTPALQVLASHQNQAQQQPVNEPRPMQCGSSKASMTAWALHGTPSIKAPICEKLSRLPVLAAGQANAAAGARAQPQPGRVPLHIPQRGERRSAADLPGPHPRAEPAARVCDFLQASPAFSCCKQLHHSLSTRWLIVVPSSQHLGR